MNKEVKVLVKSNNNLVLEEDAKKGDIINLNNIEGFNFTFIVEQIKRETELQKDKIINDLWNKEKNNVLRTSNEFISLEANKKFLEDKLQNEEKNYKLLLKDKEAEINLLKQRKEDEIEIALSNKEKEFTNKVNEYLEKINQIKLEKQKEIDKQNNKIKELESNKNYEINIALSNKEKEFTNKEKEYLEKINQIKLEKQREIDKQNNKIKELENNKNYELSIALSKKEKEFINQINEIKLEKQKEIDKYNNKIDSLEKSKNYEINIALSNKEREFADKINEIKLQNQKELEEQEKQHKKEIDLIQGRNYSNIKIEGNNFENYLQSEFDKNLSWLDNVTFEKINDVGQKADFIFNIYNDDNSVLLTSVIIEAKTELEGSQYKKKNSDHYKKLDEDRKRKNGEYALLVSTLEQENQFIFKKVSEYDKMYLIRPQFFTSFLSLIYSLAQKQKEIKVQEINLKTKQEILIEFNKMKDDILNGVIQKITNNLEKALKQVENIQSSAEQIRSSISVINNTHIQTVINKIEKFKIKQLTKKIENLPQQEYNVNLLLNENL